MKLFGRLVNMFPISQMSTRLCSKCSCDWSIDKPTGVLSGGEPVFRALGTPVFCIVAVNSVEILWNHDSSPFHNGIHPEISQQCINHSLRKLLLLKQLQDPFPYDVALVWK